ncbi:MAG: hypothetical protein ACI80V_003089 [Rhodothermales bacterium]|jgi:hypothetical protein
MNACKHRGAPLVCTLVLGLLLVSPTGLLAQTQEIGPDGRPIGMSGARSARIVTQDRPVSIEALTGDDADVPGSYGKPEIRASLTSRSFLADGITAVGIGTGAPANSLQISDNGWVGLGTETPQGRLHVVGSLGDAGTRDLLLLDETGNLEIGGVLSEASSIHLKDRIRPVDGDDVLERLLSLPVQTWNYTTDLASTRHMGVMAQDFHAAFGLGSSEEAIAVLDVSGVTMAGLQALAAQVEAQSAVIEELRMQNTSLLRRLKALESR